MIFALPVACLYLPIVLKWSLERRFGALIGWSVIFGPGCLFAFMLVISVVRGQSPWRDNGPAPGNGALLVFAAVVAFLATVIYVAGLMTMARVRRGSE
jgi:hypothetical protein